PAVAEAEAVAAEARRAGPAARRLAAERAVDLSQIPGSGPGGRVLPEDVQRYAAPAQAPAPAAAPTPAPPTTPAPAPAAPTANGVVPSDRAAREERVRVSRRRQTIAARLVEAQHTAAMLTTFNEVDMSAVMEIRRQRRDAFKERHGVGL